MVLSVMSVTFELPFASALLEPAREMAVIANVV
jgi:hypothetical protein